MRVFNLKNYNKILDETPFQTAGPFLHIGCMPNKIKINNLYKNDLGEVPFKNKNEIEMITIEGSVFDGNGITLDDVMLETWQCDENSQFFEDNGFARFIPDKLTKKFKLFTVKPGQVKNLDSKNQSPHICLSISSRGLNMTLNTRIYFEGDDLINDPILSMIKNNKGNIDSLVAKKIKKNVYAFDVFLQGDKETVFFDI
jgi:protocatechuate 3,4-dioxygenase alpha subunit